MNLFFNWRSTDALNFGKLSSPLKCLPPHRLPPKIEQKRGFFFFFWDFFAVFSLFILFLLFLCVAINGECRFGGIAVLKSHEERRDTRNLQAFPCRSTHRSLALRVCVASANPSGTLFLYKFGRFSALKPHSDRALCVGKNSDVLNRNESCGGGRVRNSSLLAQGQLARGPEQDKKIFKISEAVKKISDEENRLKRTELSKEAEKRKELTKEWRVLLCNDNIHTFQYVTDTLVSVLPLLSKAKAHTITVEAHRNGQASVISTWKQRAEMYALALQKSGLTVSLMPDKRLKNKKNDQSDS